MPLAVFGSSGSLHDHMVSPPSLLSPFPSPLHYPLIYSGTKPFSEVTSQCVFEISPNKPS